MKQLIIYHIKCIKFTMTFDIKYVLIDIEIHIQGDNNML